MQAEQGRGLQVLKRLADDALSRLDREEAASFIDAMSPSEFVEVLKVMSAAGCATDTGGNLFYESAARRIANAEARLIELEQEVSVLKAPLSTVELQDLKPPELLRLQQRADRLLQIVRPMMRGFETTARRKAPTSRKAGRR